MKKTGDICKVDSLGRIVIPVRLRRTLNLNKGDPLEIYSTENDEIVLKKYIPICVFCGKDDDLVDFKSKYICKSCISEINKE